MVRSAGSGIRRVARQFRAPRRSRTRNCRARTRRMAANRRGVIAGAYRFARNRGSPATQTSAPMSEVVILHNPRCSKSREALALIESRGIAPRIVDYLAAPPSAAELESILDVLGVEPRAIMR